MCAAAGSPATTDGTLDGVLSLPEVPQRQYRLSPIPAENQQLQSEFYYEQVWSDLHLIISIWEWIICYSLSWWFKHVYLQARVLLCLCVCQAPSASLCVSILSLHSDHAACGHQLIDHCRSISGKLTNPEVDPRLLTDVMQQLMFSAKLMFVRAGRSQDLALCDRLEHRRT